MHLLFDTAFLAPVRGWLRRAEKLVGARGDTPVHAWFAVVRNFERMLAGDARGAREWARQAIEVGQRCDPAAAAIGRVAEARGLILVGELDEGLAQLDEAGVAAVSGELDPMSTGVVYCELVCALQAPSWWPRNSTVSTPTIAALARSSDSRSGPASEGSMPSIPSSPLVAST